MFSVVAQTSTLTPWLGLCITMSSLVPPPPANTPPVPHDDPSPPRLRTLPSPDDRPPRPILRLIVVSLLPQPPSVIVLLSPSPHPGRLLIVVLIRGRDLCCRRWRLRRCRPLPSSSADIGRCRCPRTMRRCLPSTQTAVAFVEPQSPLSCRCRCLPWSYDAAVVVVRCRC